MTEPDWDRLDEAWEPARRAGVLGRVDLESIREHAAGFVPAACGVLDGASCVDVGTGAGVPGLVLALLFPGSRWTLVDGNERRANLARRAVHAMELDARVDVRQLRAEDAGRSPDLRGSADLAVARLLGPPAETTELVLPLVAGSGVAVVSAEDQDSRWVGAFDRPEWDLARRREPTGVFMELRWTTNAPDDWPRRPKARHRAPLF